MTRYKKSFPSFSRKVTKTFFSRGVKKSSFTRFSFVVVFFFIIAILLFLQSDLLQMLLLTDSVRGAFSSLHFISFHDLEDKREREIKIEKRIEKGEDGES